MVKTSIFFEASFNSGHWLPKVPADHKCRRPHGHTYRVRITASGPVGSDGFVIDYAELGKAWGPLHSQLDHRVLNDVHGLENPTSENIARWIGERMRVSLPMVCEVCVRETETAGSIVRWDE